MVMAEERSDTDRPETKRTHALTKNQSKFDVVDVKEILCEDKASFKDSIKKASLDPPDRSRLPQLPGVSGPARRLPVELSMIEVGTTPFLTFS